MAECGPDEIVEASVKYDGSLGIAFLWNGEVRVTSRRRMDSEQAIWAQQWIKDHCDVGTFQAGYTYMFEIIYQNNTVIVKYLFEGLVLLAVTNESGHELSYEEALHCGRTTGFFMVTPRITAPYSEVLWYCGGIDITLQESTTRHPSSSCKSTSGALPVNENRQEGWVVKLKDGRRQKIVYSWWKDGSRIAQLVHPQIVWLLLKYGRIKEILGDVPNQFRVEISRMTRALGRKFTETIRDVEDHLRVSSFKSHASVKSRKKVAGKFSIDAMLDIDRNKEYDASSEDEEFYAQTREGEMRKKNSQLVIDGDKVTRSDYLRSRDSEKNGNTVYGIWSSFLYSSSDESEGSGDEMAEKSDEIRKQTEQLSLSETGVVARGDTSSKDDVEPQIEQLYLNEDDVAGRGKTSIKYEKKRQTKQLSLDEDDVVRRDATSSKDENIQCVQESGVFTTKNTKDFLKLARKLKPRWKVAIRPTSFYKNTDEDVNLSPIYNREKVNYLRLPVLDYICPTSPVLDGYEPSNNFKQTWCKGWKTLPINQFQFIQEVLQENHQIPPFLQLPVVAISVMLEYLDGMSLVNMRKVCMLLRQIVESSKAFRKKIAKAKEDKHILEMEMSTRYHQPSYGRSNYWGGYGSDYGGASEDEYEVKKNFYDS